MLKVGIVGAAGYAGAELVRIVLRHPEFDLRVITSNSDEGATLASVYPAFSGVTDLAFSRHDNAELFNCDVVFSCHASYGCHEIRSWSSRLGRYGG